MLGNLSSFRATAGTPLPHDSASMAGWGIGMNGCDMENDKTEALSIDTYIGRQPIFDSSKHKRAYELLYRGSAEATSADYADEHIATLHVIANTLFSTDPEAAQGRLFVNYSRQGILDKTPLTFPPGSVVKIKESLGKDKDVIRCLKEFRAADYLIAIDDFSECDAPQLHTLADVFIIDFLTPAGDLAALIKSAQKHSGTVMAKRIENNKQFEYAKELGADLFQGFFFHEPEVVPGKRFTSSECSRLNLLKIIKEEDQDFDALTDAIQMDPTLTHRMLFYINSPYFGLSSQITSVKHAISLLGWSKVKNLLYMVILTDANSPLSNELFITSATRAMFLKMTAEEHPQCSQSPDQLYIMGLLSLLDAIFQVPMEEIVADIALEKELKTMLVKQKGELYKWIRLAMAFEAGDWQQTDHLIASLNLDFVKVAKGYYEALKWVNSFYGTLA